MGVRVFGSDGRGVFKYYLKTGFTGGSSSKGFSLASYDKDYVELFDVENGFRKRFSFLPASYEVQIEDTETGSSIPLSLLLIYPSPEVLNPTP